MFPGAMALLERSLRLDARALIPHLTRFGLMVTIYACVIAAIEPVAARRAEAEAEIGCRTYASFDEFLQDPVGELIVLATPSGGHGPETLACLDRGLHGLQCGWKNRQEPIPGGFDHLSLVGFDCPSQDGIMRSQRGFHCYGLFFP